MDVISAKPSAFADRGLCVAAQRRNGDTGTFTALLSSLKASAERPARADGQLAGIPWSWAPEPVGYGGEALLWRRRPVNDKGDAGGKGGV